MTPRPGFWHPHGFIDRVPDEYIDAEWELTKRLQFGQTLIPNKYKEIIGLGISAATRCRYCTLFHAEAAKLFGASDAEVEESAHYGKLVGLEPLPQPPADQRGRLRRRGTARRRTRAQQQLTVHTNGGPHLSGSALVDGPGQLS